MFKKLRDKCVEFINSEEGKVGVKTSLSLGLVGGGILLMQTMFPAAAEVHFECFGPEDCAEDETCKFWIDPQGEYHSECRESPTPD